MVLVLHSRVVSTVIFCRKLIFRVEYKVKVEKQYFTVHKTVNYYGFHSDFLQVACWGLICVAA